MKTTIRGILVGLGVAAVSTMLALGQQGMPKSSTEQVKGQATTKTEQLSGTVVSVEGNNLLVRMTDGEMRLFTPPASRRFVIDGKEVGVADLRPGTKLTATVTTTTTSVTERTTTVGSGKVWYVSGNTVILTLPNNENKMYKVADSYKFNVDGQPATVRDLKKGMRVSAEKIVEVPRTEIATNVGVTGSAPPPVQPKKEVAQTQALTPAPAPAPAPRKKEPAPEPAPAPAPVAETAPAKLPKTGSSVPLAGLLGLLSIGAAFSLRKLRG